MPRGFENRERLTSFQVLQDNAMRIKLSRIAAIHPSTNNRLKLNQPNLQQTHNYLQERNSSIEDDQIGLRKIDRAPHNKKIILSKILADERKPHDSDIVTLANNIERARTSYGRYINFKRRDPTWPDS